MREVSRTTGIGSRRTQSRLAGVGLLLPTDHCRTPLINCSPKSRKLDPTYAQWLPGPTSAPSAAAPLPAAGGHARCCRQLGVGPSCPVEPETETNGLLAIQRNVAKVFCWRGRWSEIHISPCISEVRVPIAFARFLASAIPCRSCLCSRGLKDSSRARRKRVQLAQTTTLASS